MKITLKKFALIACLAATCVASSASKATAAIEAFSRLDILDIAIFTDSFGAKRQLALSDLTGVLTSDSASASAVLNGSGVATAAAAGIDTLQAYVGPGPAPVENDFSRQVGAALSFARGDTAGGGTIIDVGAGATFAFATTVAETQLLPVANADNGTSASDVGTTAEITFTVGAAGLHLIAEMRADILLVAELVTSPPGKATSASANWSMTITDVITGLPVFIWAPNGSGAVFGGGSIADPYSLNASVGQLTTGTDTISGVGGFFSADTTLAAGTYTLKIAHGSTSNAENFVPEPTSFLVWGILAMVGFFGKGRRSSSRK